MTVRSEPTLGSLRRLLTVVGTALCFVVGAAIPSTAIEIDDPGLFGPGESWELGPLRPGAANPWVADLQRALNRSGFWVGEVDGVFGAQTVAAVHAFQKLNGLERDGVFLPEHWAMLDRPITAPGSTGEPDRIEVDLDRQILFLIQESRVTKVLPVSSGNGSSYVNSTGSLVTARTPEGRYVFNRQRNGWHESYLGFMYAPFYFRGGYAIHGSGSVPAYPASHGCVRVTVTDMNYLRGYLHLGMPVYVYGSRVDRSRLFPDEPTPPSPPPPRAI